MSEQITIQQAVQKITEFVDKSNKDKKLLRQSIKLGLDMAIELIDLRNKLKENNNE